MMSVVCCMLVIWLISVVHGEKAEFCPSETLRLQCPSGEVIVMKSAVYGRMEFTRCLEVDQYIGCSNDVMSVLDNRCSGRQQCDLMVNSNEMRSANTECLRFLQMYVSVEYTCVKVLMPTQSECGGPNYSVKESEGFISSQVTHETKCGSTRSPWLIQALPGQNIQLIMVDFNSDVQSNTTDSPDTILYGYVIEDGERNAFHSGLERQREIYVSETDSVKIEVLAMREDSPGFLLQYKKAGCPDLKPPAHAWYKRDGGQAVIGCEWSQKTWHLSCDGHSWSGVVGNCSEPTTQQPIKEQEEIELPSALLLTCVVSVAVVLAAVVLVCGVVCIKKFRIKHEIEKATTMPRQYGHYDLDPNIEMASMMYLPYKPCEHEGILVDVNSPVPAIEPAQGPTDMSPIHIWQQPLPDVPPRVDNLTAATMPAYPVPSKRGRTPGDGDEGFSGHEDDTLRSGQSNFSSLNNHKYSALHTAPVH